MINKDEIIQMAREAGFHEWYSTPEREYHFGCVTKFAALVASAERRKCATACYVKAYEINAMGDTDMHPAKAAELCAVAISVMP